MRSEIRPPTSPFFPALLPPFSGAGRQGMGACSTTPACSKLCPGRENSLVCIPCLLLLWDGALFVLVHTVILNHKHLLLFKARILPSITFLFDLRVL